MKRILCYGDSLTWGLNPSDWSRYEPDQTWTGELQNNLGTDYQVITESLPGRTTCFNSPFLPYRSGADALPMILESHSPLNLVIFFLGINDMNKSLNADAEKSAWGLFSLIRLVLFNNSGYNFLPPKILVISPPPIGKLSEFMSMSFAGNESESLKLYENYKKVCDLFAIPIINSADYVKVSDIDGLHLEPSEQLKLGKIISEKVLSMNI